MPETPQTPHHILSGDAYYKALTHAIPQAKKRVVLAAMYMLSDPQTKNIFEALKNAARRGVSVRILLDSYYTRFRAPQVKERKLLKPTFAALEELKTLGARVYYFGGLSFMPYHGRCHLKITVVDDDTYSFGGINFSEASFAAADYMIHTASARYADCLEELVKRVGGTRPPLANGEVEIDKESTILFDGGRRHSSVIYEKACELTAQAVKVHYVSQMVPSSKLAHLLHEVNSTLFFNRPEQMSAPDSWGQAFDQQKYRLTNSYTGNQFIHAKFILFELPGGRRALLSGSNNFSYRGVAFGTQEIALYSTNRPLWNELHQFIKKRIAAS